MGAVRGPLHRARGIGPPIWHRRTRAARRPLAVRVLTAGVRSLALLLHSSDGDVGARLAPLPEGLGVSHRCRPLRGRPRRPALDLPTIGRRHGRRHADDLHRARVGSQRSSPRRRRGAPGGNSRSRGRSRPGRGSWRGASRRRARIRRGRKQAEGPAVRPRGVLAEYPASAPACVGPRIADRELLDTFRQEKRTQTVQARDVTVDRAMLESGGSPPSG